MRASKKKLKKLWSVLKIVSTCLQCLVTSYLPGDIMFIISDIFNIGYSIEGLIMMQDLKIAMAQINPIIGDLKGNFQLAKTACKNSM